MKRKASGQRTYRMAALAVAIVLLCTSAVLLGRWLADGNGQEDAARRDANTFYEIFVRAFHDSDGDGIGDLNGITEKLDYLREMGFSGIWLTPIHPSPSYHGYDVTDYYAINPDFGTMDDFERLVEEAHARGIRIILDLVVNHTSNEHPWFLESAQGPDSPKRDWYVWADDVTNTNAVSAIGGKAWHVRNGGHYLGIFWHGMPDLNPDSPEVQEEFQRIARFWLDKGVDGFRLDAAKHLYENFPHESGKKAISDKNTAWWRAFRAGLEEVKPDVYLVGEVWDTATVIGPYLDGAFNAGFNFDLAGQLIAMAKNETAIDIGFTVGRIHDYYERVSNGTFEDAVILSNHDQNRVMSQLSGNVDHAKTAAALLLTMPGKPYVYYGEEIGMEGVKPDENLRRPMRWEIVDAQAEDPDSLLSRYKLLIHWRKQEPVLARGKIESHDAGNDRVASFVRDWNGERVLVLHNLSGEGQYADAGSFGGKAAIILQTSREAKLENGKVWLPPYGSAVLK